MNSEKVLSGKHRIESMQALRALAFLGIFFSHAGFFVAWPAFGVSIFFVMSGFLMVYTYEDKEFNISLYNNIHFSLKKVRLLYPLHIITMFCAVILQVVGIIIDGFTSKSVISLLGKIGLNITLLQTWIPCSRVNVSLNGVAWYLSVTMFLYFTFPWLHKFVKRQSIDFLSMVCMGILLLEVIVCIPFVQFLGNDSCVYIWFMYCFPVFRLGDFFTGCCLGKFYNCNKATSIKFCKANVIEILSAVVTVSVFVWLKKDYSNIIIEAMHNWTTLYIPLAAIWVYLFAKREGLITRILSNRVLIYIGNISSYLFLIHYVVILCINSFARFVDINLLGIGKGILVFVELALSILLSISYKKLKHV